MSDLLQDQHDEHFGLFQGDTLLACLTISMLDQNTAKMRQVAVAESQQRMGFGRTLILQVEETLRLRKVNQIYCHARETAIPFYLHLGYAIVDEPFTEVGLPHRKMVHTL
ncbi:MAG: GNAT family N-acetyltransferase [Chitinophagales bacterium]